MKYWAACVVLIFICLITVACSNVATPKIAVNPTISNGPMITGTLGFTKTPKPTTTFTIFPTIETTPTIPPATMAIVATIEALVTEKPGLERFYSRFCIVYGYTCYANDSLGLSPNKEWAVFFNTKNGSGGLNIVNIDSKKQIDIYFHEITGFSGSDVWVNIEHWSRDGRYLYVSPYISGSGGDGFFWRNYIQLIRINLENGTWVDTKMGSGFSFSPTDGFIAYCRGQNIVVYEFQSGIERTFALPAEYVVFGRFLWSEDSKQIIFISSPVAELLTDEAIGKPKGFSLFLLNVADMSVRTILEKDGRYLFPVEWQAPNLVLLEGLYTVSSDDTLEFGGKKYLLDLQTNNISEYESP